MDQPNPYNPEQSVTSQDVTNSSLPYSNNFKKNSLKFIYPSLLLILVVLDTLAYTNYIFYSSTNLPDQGINTFGSNVVISIVLLLIPPSLNLLWFGLTLLLLYFLPIYIYLRFINLNKPQRLFTIRRFVVFILLCLLAANFFAKQNLYLNLVNQNSVDYPCSQPLCLDNYFPATTSISSEELRKIDFTIFLPTPPPKGASLRFFEVNPSTKSNLQFYLTGRNNIQGEYLQGISAFQFAEAKSNSSIGDEYLNGSFKNVFSGPYLTPKNRQIYLGPNTAMTVIGGTLILVQGYYADISSQPPYGARPEILQLIDSFSSSPISTLKIMPKGILK